MAYDKTNWENLPNTTTPLYDVNLNKIENKLSDLDTDKANLATTPQTPSGNTQVNTIQLGFNDGGWVLNINANTSGQNVDFAVGIQELANYYSIQKALENMLHFIPQFTNLIGDNSTLNVNINSSLEGFYLFINSHINLREVYIITFYSNIGLKVDTIYRNSDAQGSTTFSISGNTLTINGAVNCRGQLYYVPQMLAK